MNSIHVFHEKNSFDGTQKNPTVSRGAF